MPSPQDKSLEKTLKNIENRLKKLEKVSHKQPDMKKMLKNAAEVIDAVKETPSRKPLRKPLRKPSRSLTLRC